MTVSTRLVVRHSTRNVQFNLQLYSYSADSTESNVMAVQGGSTILLRGDNGREYGPNEHFTRR
jgi:hypothetical protein